MGGTGYFWGVSFCRVQRNGLRGSIGSFFFLAGGLFLVCSDSVSVAETGGSAEGILDGGMAKWFVAT